MDIETEVIIVPIQTAPEGWRPKCNYSGTNSRYCGKDAVYVNGDLDMGGDTVEEMAASLYERTGGYRNLLGDQFVCKRHLGVIRATDSRRRWGREQAPSYTDVWPETFLNALYSVMQERARIRRAESDAEEAKRQEYRAARIAALIKEYDTEADGYVAPAKPTFVVMEEPRYDNGRTIKVVKVGGAEDRDREVITYEVCRSRIDSYGYGIEPASIRVSLGSQSEAALMPECMNEVAVAAARAKAYLDAFQREFVEALKAGKETE